MVSDISSAATSSSNSQIQKAGQIDPENGSFTLPSHSSSPAGREKGREVSGTGGGQAGRSSLGLPLGVAQTGVDSALGCALCRAAHPPLSSSMWDDTQQRSGPASHRGSRDLQSRMYLVSRSFTSLRSQPARTSGQDIKRILERNQDLTPRSFQCVTKESDCPAGSTLSSPQDSSVCPHNQHAPNEPDLTTTAKKKCNQRHFWVLSSAPLGSSKMLRGP